MRPVLVLDAPLDPEELPDDELLVDPDDWLDGLEELEPLDREDAARESPEARSVDEDDEPRV